MNTAKTWLKKAIVFLVVAAMAIALFPFTGLRTVTKAAVTDAPATQKNLYNNGDGTYTLSLSVTGEAESSSTTEVTKANVILVLDTSSSMNANAGSTYYQVVGTPRNPAQDGNNKPTYYRLNGTIYQQVYYRNNAWRETDSNNGRVFTGTFYCRSRLWAEKDALTKTDGIIDNLLKQNVPGDPNKSDIIEVSVISFDMDGGLRQSFTTSATSLKNTINGLVTDSGTNWEEALQLAKTQADAIKATQTDEDVFIIFLTDGQPSVDAIGGGGQDHNIASNATGWHNAWNQAQDDARAIVQAGYKFYSLFTWGDSGYASYLQGLVLRAYTGNNSYNYDSTIPAGSEYASYYTNASSTEALIEALNQIIHNITESVGYTNVELEDGVTAMTTSNIKTTAGGQVTGLKYYRAGGDYGTFDPTKGQYGTEWAEAPKATVNEDGEVDWNLGNTVLENGVTYTATFVVWPSQESIDLVADLNNGVVSYSSLTPEQRAQIHVSGGVYTLKTNTDYPTVTYSTVTTTTVDGVPTTVVSEPQTATITNPPDVGLAESKLNAVKSWEDTLDPSQREEIDDVELFLKVDGKDYYVDADGKPLGVTLTEESNWTFTDYISIAPGLMVTEESPAYDPDATHVTWGGHTYAIIEPGHEYVFEESDINNHFELTAYTHHPMIMGENADHTPHIVDVIFTKDASGNITGIESFSEMGDNISATNTLKGGINITKKVVDENGDEVTDLNPFTITVNVTDPKGNALPTKTTADGIAYTIDYRIYYGPNNPNYDAAAGGGRSNHIYVRGTSFNETIYVGDTIRVVNVEDDTLYNVEETVPTGYSPNYTVGYTIAYGKDAAEAATPVVIDEETYYTVQGNSASYADITNTYVFGELQVSKTVAVESGDEEQAKAKEFEFTFKLYEDDTKEKELTGLKFNYTKTDAEGETTTGTITESGTFNLKDGEKFQIEKLPEGTFYEVTETAATGYTTEATGDTGSIVKNETAQAEFTNTYRVTPITVNPPVKKDITGTEELYNKGDFIFTIANTAAPTGVTAPMPTKDGAAVTEITNSADYELEDKPGYYEFGEIKFEVPGTYKYAVTESGSAIGVTNDEEATKTLTFTVTDKGDGTLEVTPGTDSAVFNFTNVYKTGELDITKTVENAANPQDNTKFTFTVTFKDSTGATVEGSFPYTIAEATGDIASGGTLELANGETAIITEIPDGVSYTVKETVKDGYTVTTKTGDTGTIDDVEAKAKAAKFTNTYNATGEAVLEVTKALAGADWPEGQTLTFTLTGEGGTLPETTTVTLTEAGKATFGAITYDESDAGKTYEYTISEGNGFGTGWTGSGDITATVEVTDSGNGKLATKVTYSSNATITNTYTAEGEAVLEVTKALAGADWPEGKTLTFTLTGEGGTLPEATTVTLTKAGKATFGAITYDESDAGKTYEYTISEGNGFGTGWTGSGDVTATVKVTDKGDGNLATKVTYSPDATITNTYAAEGSATIEASKELTGRAWKDGETVTFTLLGPDGGKIEEKTIGENGKISFTPINYTEADAGKEYKYTISETSELPDGVSKSEAITATVKVTDEGDGKLATKVTYDNDDKIVNTYTAKPVKATINVNKIIDGYIEGEDKNGNVVDRTFNFTLTGAKIDGQLTTSITTNGGEGSSSFDEIEFTFDDMVDENGNRLTEKVFTYKVTETAGSDAGFEYDKNEYEVNVTVKDDQNGSLTTTIGYPSTETTAVDVINKFEEQGAEVKLTVNKVIEDLSNSAEDATFTFVLKNSEGNPIQTKTITTENFEGTVDFDPIKYSEAGTYNYTIQESGEAPSGWTYDTKEYPVVITVSDNFATAVLESETTIDGETKTALTITNTYKAESTTGTIEVTKSIEDTSGSAPTDTVFTFILATEDESPMPEVTTTSVTGAGKASFAPITYEKAGTFNYTITEEAGDGNGWIYDTTVYPVTVTVTDVDGALSAVAAYGKESKTSLTITNKYDPEDAKAAPKARKVVEDKSGSAPDETFTFNLLDKDGKVVETKTRENGGYVEFSELTFDKIGTYEYTIQEVKGTTPGFKYDTAPRELSINVTDEGEGSLAAKITYKDANKDGEVVITNVYEPDPVPVETSEYLKKVVDKMRPKVESETFSFTLEEMVAEGEEAAEPLNATVKATNAGEYPIDFGTLTFDKVGTYTYTLTEVLDNLDGGWVVTGNPATVTIEVTDKNGKLVADVSEYKITNTFETVKVEGEKIWDDKDIADWEGYEHPEIKIVLSDSDGQWMDSTTLNEESGWKYEFKDLPKYKTDANGNRGVEIKYVVTETNTDGDAIAAEGYTVVVSDNNATVTNTPVVKEKDNPLELTIKKIDSQTKAALKGAEFTLTDADEKETVYKVGADGTVDITFTKAGEYTLEETKVPEGYENPQTYKIVVEREKVSVSLETEEELTFWQKLYNLIFGDGTDFDEATVTLTVPNDPIKTKITAEKTWYDNDDAAGKRPSSITVKVTGTAAGETVYENSQTLNASTDWKYTWENLATYYSGNEITYTVTEDAVSGYDSAVGELKAQEDGTYVVNITNILLIDIPVEKTWVDFNNKYNLRPEEITLNLYSNQSKEAVATATVTPDDKGAWKYTFTQVPAYTAEGTKIEYRVEEDDVEVYDGEVSGSADEGFRITNTLQTGDLKITKDLTRYNDFINGNGDAVADQATFIFEITATWGENTTPIYHDFVALTFDGSATTKTIELNNKLPVGAKVTVKEVDSGPSYKVEGNDEVTDLTITEGTADVATANFRNAYDDRIPGGYGIVNQYTKDNEGNWSGKDIGDNAPAPTVN